MLAVAHSADTDFAAFMEGVSRKVWGEPNRALSGRGELRWGSQGSRVVELEKGVWHDHENGIGGGVLDLLKQEKGLTVGEAMDWLRNEGFQVAERESDRSAPQRIEAVYEYVDEAGAHVFQVVRFGPKKDFRQRQRDPESRDGWNWKVKGVRQVPYRLPDVIEAVAMGRKICIVEGEKDVEALWALGIPATCNAGGAGKWPPGLAEHFVGADVVILPDNDDAGRNHCAVVASALKGIAKSVGVLDLPNLPPKGDVSDWLAAGNPPQAIEPMLEHGVIPWASAPPVSRFGAVTWLGISRLKPRTDYLVDELLFPADLLLTYGESRSGKSFLSIDLSMAIARGVPFFDMQTRQGAVIYQAGEGASGVVSRLQAYGINYHLATTDLPFVLMKSRIDLYSHDGDVDAFIAELRAWQAWLPCPLSLVTIDTFSAATPGANENTSEDMSRIISNGKRIKEATGAAVNFVHHKNAGGVKARGHTSLFADADAAIDVVRDEETNQRHFRLAKVKDGEDGKKFGFKLQPVDIGSNDDGKILTSCVVIPAQEDDPRTGNDSGSRPLTTAQRKFLMTLDDAITHRGGQLSSGDNIPYNMRGVEWGKFTSLYRSLCAPDQTDEAIRKALSRDGDWLLTRGIIGRWDRWIWISDKGRGVL